MKRRIMYFRIKKPKLLSQSPSGGKRLWGGGETAAGRPVAVQFMIYLYTGNYLSTLFGIQTSNSKA